MRSRFLLFSLLALAFSPPSFGQSSPGAKTFNLKAANQNACIGTAGLPTVAIDLSGTSSLTLQPQVSINGSTPKNSSATSTVAGSLPQATIVTSGSTSASYVAPVGGFDTFCLTVSSYISGTATVILNPSPVLNGALLGGPGAVLSVFTRTGAVVAQSGDYTCAEVTGCTPGGIPINGTPVALPAAVTSFNLFGDSITGGLGVQYQTQSYGYLTAAALGQPVANDYGVSGYDIQQITKAAYAVTPSPALASMTILGANDISTVGSGYTLAQYALQQQAYAVWLGAPTDQMVPVSGMTFTGSWITQLQGMNLKYSTGTIGNTATAHVSGTTVYLGTYVFGGLTTAFTVTIDGVLTDTQSISISAAPVFLCLRYPGLTSGSHTVVITANTTGNYAVVQFIAGNGGTQFPFELIGNTIPRNSPSTVASMNAGLATMVANLQADGLEVYVVNDNAAVSESANPPEYEPSLTHPNALGNFLIANAFLNTAYASNAVANLNAQFLAAELQAVIAIPATPISGTAISSSSSPCNVGYAAIDPGLFLDVCVGTNSWFSIPLQAFHANPGSYPINVGSVSCTQATCAALATNLLASAANAQYAIDITVNCVSSTSTATATITVAYTDPSNTAQTITPGLAAACTTLGAASVVSVNHQVIRAKSGTAITYAATTANTPTYQASVTVTQETSN